MAEDLHSFEQDEVSAVERLGIGHRTKVDDVASFGQNLRQAREARKMTLQDIASVTKIGTRSLQALEEERFDQLPGGIFNKGFVRSYARSVGLDEDKTVAAYVEAAKDGLSDTDMQAMATQVAASRQPVREPWVFPARGFVAVLAVVVALGTGALWFKEHRQESRELSGVQSRPENPTVNAAPPSVPAQNVTPNDPNAVANGTPNPGAPAPAANDPAQGSTQSALQNASTAGNSGAGEPSAPVEISISAKARAWISVRSDGKQVETLTLDPEKPESRVRSYTAKEKLMLVVGNPAGLAVTYNGKPAGTLGEEGHRATITFTPDGMQKQ